MITIIIVISLLEIGTIYGLFYNCSKDNNYEKYILKLKKEHSEERMLQLLSYYDKVKELHLLAIDEQDSIEEINSIFEIYIDLITKYEGDYMLNYTKYHTVELNKKLYEIITAERQTVVNPAIHFIKSRYVENLL